VGPSCCSLVTADFNGDGKPDLAVTFSDNLDAGGRQLLVLMGNGDGSFTARNLVDLGQSFMVVAAVDVNSDKKPDLIITQPFNGGSSVLLGNGDGTFQPGRTIGTGVLRVADFNGDGKPDLLCAGLTVRLGNGDGTFGSPISTPAVQNFTPLSFAGAIAVGDFNGDGKLDVAHTSAWHDAFGMVWVWMGNGDGTFRPQFRMTCFPMEATDRARPRWRSVTLTATGNSIWRLAQEISIPLPAPAASSGSCSVTATARSAKEQRFRSSDFFSPPRMSIVMENRI
jgi:hypothetical protein